MRSSNWRNGSPCCSEGSVLVEGTPEEIKGNVAVQEAYLGGVHARMSLLEVNGLNSYYGDSHILFDVALRVERNEVVALLGRNGAGKSTTLKSLMGVVTPRSGAVMLDGDRRRRQDRHAIAQAGMQLVPEERRIFGSLNVEENIILAGLTASNRWPLDRIYAMFPRLQGAAREPRHRPVRRRAADAGDRARAGARSEDRPARRAVRGPGAGDRARSDGGLPRARRGRADHRAGRAEPRGHARARAAAPTSSTTATSCTKARPPRSRPTRRYCTAILAFERAASQGHGNRAAIADNKVDALEPKNECVRNGGDDPSEA